MAITCQSSSSDPQTPFCSSRTLPWKAILSKSSSMGPKIACSSEAFHKDTFSRLWASLLDNRRSLSYILFVFPRFLEWHMCLFLFHQVDSIHSITPTWVFLPVYQIISERQALLNCSSRWSSSLICLLTPTSVDRFSVLHCCGWHNCLCQIRHHNLLCISDALSYKYPFELEPTDSS